MTQDADFKKLVRARMVETGENYTAARATLLQCTPPAHPEAPLIPRPTGRACSFFDGDRLRTIPTKRTARVAVMFELALCFEPGRSYPEPEVNELLRRFHDDYAYLRRELVDFGYLVRADGIYRLAEALPERDPRWAHEFPPDEAERFEQHLRR